MLDILQFRRGGTTLGWPPEGFAVLELDPVEQRRLLVASPPVRAQASLRRRQGMSLIERSHADEALIEAVLKSAWAQAYGQAREWRDPVLDSPRPKPIRDAR